MLKLKYGFTALILIAIFISSCRIEPQPIEYGSDQCIFCKMNIVDKAHSAQMVTDKGKQFKYDAIECMVRDLNKRESDEISIKLVANFDAPGAMIEAETAQYIISPGIKSPMGENLSAVDQLTVAEKLIDQFGGDIFTWEGINTKINK